MRQLQLSCQFLIVDQSLRRRQVPAVLRGSDEAVLPSDAHSFEDHADREVSDDQPVSQHSLHDRLQHTFRLHKTVGKRYRVRASRHPGSVLADHEDLIIESQFGDGQVFQLEGPSPTMIGVQSASGSAEQRVDGLPAAWCGDDADIVTIDGPNGTRAAHGRLERKRLGSIPVGTDVAGTASPESVSSF